MTNEIFTDEIMNDAALELITGGAGRDWYYRPETMEMEDLQNLGKKIIKKGYIIEGEYQKSGAKIHSRFMTIESFERFKKENADDRFYEGSLSIGQVA